MVNMTIAMSDYNNGPFVQCAYYDGPGYINQFRVVRCTTPVQGRFLRLSRTARVINVCEVEVYGYYI